MSWPAPDGKGVVVVVAHPDDDVLGCGALLGNLRDVLVVHVTDGSPRDGADARRHGFATPPDYAAARRREALAALAAAGIGPDRLLTLGCADQDVPAHLADIARRLVPLIDGAAIVLTHAYEGGHGDHDAVAFAVHAACRLASTAPPVIEMPFYHHGTDGWAHQTFLPAPEPAPDPRVEPGLASWAAAHGLSGTDLRRWAGSTHVLAPAERALKARMIDAHATQVETLATFRLDAERFRLAPDHDFLGRPHDGALLYELHGWNLTWPAWQVHVRRATSDLGLAPA